MDKLKKIIDYKQLELEHRRRALSQKDLEKMLKDQELARSFLSHFDDSDINIIAEIKKASPSTGIIRIDFDPVKIAQIYQEGGAKALSVLTDDHFFKGNIKYIQDVKAVVQLPVLRKDFTLSEYHIFEGRAHQADAILLIAAILDDVQLKDYHDLTLELGMTPLVEVHNQDELNKVLKYNIKLLGINNRNLKTFETDIKTSETLCANNKLDMPVISESGLDSHEKVLKLKNLGVDGFLIGETLMKAKDIGTKLKELQGK